jgi:threonine aldolase
LAAAALFALDHHVSRLEEDHRNARRLADGLASAGLPIDPQRVETNFVLLDVGRLGLSADVALAVLREQGVLWSRVKDHVNM